MKFYITVLASFGLFQVAMSQKVGIGTNSPLKLLSVNGSVMIDQSNMNRATLDSAALRFGSATMVGISSNRDSLLSNVNGLDVWTNGLRRISVTPTGRIGINNINPQYTLDVGGTVNANYLYTSGIGSTGSIHTDFDLNATDDLYVGDDATILGNVGIGAAYNSSYRLRVEGNGLFTTNVGIDGTLRVNGKITNDGSGIVKSNTATTLRAGFSSGTFGISLAAGASVEVPFCITAFSGSNNNVRVMISQFIPGSGASATAGNVTFNVVGTQASGGACGSGSTATVRMSNATSSTINLGSNAVLYLFSVVTD